MSTETVTDWPGRAAEYFGTGPKKGRGKAEASLEHVLDAWRAA